jgi:hypothetical protein
MQQGSAGPNPIELVLEGHLIESQQQGILARIASSAVQNSAI